MLQNSILHGVLAYQHNPITLTATYLVLVVVCTRRVSAGLAYDDDWQLGSRVFLVAPRASGLHRSLAECLLSARRFHGFLAECATSSAMIIWHIVEEMARKKLTGN